MQNSCEDIRVALAQRDTIYFRGLGTSMQPLYPPGTVFRLKRFSTQGVKRGSLVLAEEGGRLSLHRIVKVKKGDQLQIWTKGDARTSCDPPLVDSQILATVDDVMIGASFVPYCIYNSKLANGLLAHISLTHAWVSRKLYRLGRLITLTRSHMRAQ
jgi:hypothetical protein